jgi:hypothetical protein
MREWLQHNSTNDQLSDFFVSKLATLSPCSGAFAVLRDVPSYVSAHFVDLTEAGEVGHMHSHWKNTEIGILNRCSLTALLLTIETVAMPSGPTQ